MAEEITGKAVEETEEVQPEAATGEEDASQADEATGKVTLPDGKEYEIKDLLEWRDRGLMQSDYTKKTQAAAEERKQLAKERAELEEMKAKLTAKPTEDGNPFSSLDEYVPGLGQALQGLGQKVETISQAQERIAQEAAEVVKSAEEEAAMDSALQPFEGKPFADTAKMREFMETRGWSPTVENAEAAYLSLWGFQLGETAKETQMRKRGVDAPAPMGPPSLGMPQTGANEVPAARKSVKDTSWQEYRNMAMKDPRRPKG